MDEKNEVTLVIAYDLKAMYAVEALARRRGRRHGMAHSRFRLPARRRGAQVLPESSRRVRRSAAVNAIAASYRRQALCTAMALVLLRHRRGGRKILLRLSQKFKAH